MYNNIVRTPKRNLSSAPGVTTDFAGKLVYPVYFAGRQRYGTIGGIFVRYGRLRKFESGGEEKTAKKKSKTNAALDERATNTRPYRRATTANST